MTGKLPSRYERLSLLFGTENRLRILVLLNCLLY